MSPALDLIACRIGDRSNMKLFQKLGSLFLTRTLLVTIRRARRGLFIPNAVHVQCTYKSLRFLEEPLIGKIILYTTSHINNTAYHMRVNMEPGSWQHNIISVHCICMKNFIMNEILLH